MNRAATIAACILVAFLPALTGFISRPDSWYEALIKPPLQPPSWVFGPVWMVLYFLTGLAYGLFTVAKPRIPVASKIPGHCFFIIQLALNAAWTPLFFGLRSPLFAGVEILFLLAFIAATIQAFFAVSRAAGYLLIPYFAWVAFATYLNWGVVSLNRG